MAVRITQKMVPIVRAKMLKNQGGMCPLCRVDLMQKDSPDAVLDHCHATGLLRAVLCRNCNGNAEGRIMGYALRCSRGEDPVEFVQRLVDYWRSHNPPTSNLLHYLHKTEAEKRETKNKKARVTRARAKVTSARQVREKRVIAKRKKTDG